MEDRLLFRGFFSCSDVCSLVGVHMRVGKEAFGFGEEDSNVSQPGVTISGH